MTMVRNGLLLGFALGVGLLCACGESQESPTRQDQTLGGVKEGAPIGSHVRDPGILQDQTTYQPSRIPGGGAAGSAGKGPERGGGGAPEPADKQVRGAVNGLVNAIKDGEVQLALRAFEPDQVKLLGEKADDLFATFEKIDALTKLVASKLDPGKADKLAARLRGGGDAAPKIELVDGEHAGVKPNLAAALFGPVKAAPSMQLVLRTGEWKFQLDAPLTAVDVEAIVKYHQQLQGALDSITDWVASAAKVDEAQLVAAVGKAVAGQPLELPAPGAPAPEPKPDEAAPPEQPPAQPGGEGGEQPPPQPGPGGGRERRPG